MEFISPNGKVYKFSKSVVESADELLAAKWPLKGLKTDGAFHEHLNDGFEIAANLWPKIPDEEIEAMLLAVVALRQGYPIE
jgi:hypothetical protein